ncbi:dpr-interacting protein theta isoform 2-T4 [Cochliomyia hominivorax]
MTKRESEFSTNTFTSCKSSIANSTNTTKPTIVMPQITRKAAIETRLVSLNTHNNDNNNCKPLTINKHQLQEQHQQQRPHNRKIKRKRKIPEISWLIVAICLNCYVIFSVTANQQHTTTTTTSTTTTNTNSNINNSASTTTTTSTTTNLKKQNFIKTDNYGIAALAINSHNNQRRIRAAAASAHSVDDHHLDIDDVDEMMAHHINHHTDLVDTDDMYLHNMDNIGYHHTGSLLPHELPEHDHIAHHLDLPKFGEPLQNVTVPVGREAVLQCVVDNLQTYKIAWLRVDTQTILTIQNHVITKNHRMSITHAEKRAWILRIRDVKESDKGWYMCQINTDPMKSQVGYLDVVVPPDILDYPTSTDMVVREGSNVTLKCAATGSPTPTITWRREGGEPIPIPNGTEAISYNGSFLTIAKVNRLNMGAYLCIASNGIPPTVSKRVMLIIHFPPMIWIQNQLVGAAIGQNITLECQSEAFPKSINYWMKNDTIIVPGERFVPETYENGYKITMRLTINDVDAQDFGSYRCVAKNSLGDTDGAIKFYQIPQTTTVTTLAPTAATNTVPMLVTKYHKEQRYNFQQNNNNYNHKLQRTKSKMDLPQQQQQTTLNNVYIGATSTLWNTQQQDRYSGVREHYSHQGPDHPNYRGNVDPKSTMQHDANSLSLENNEVYGAGNIPTASVLQMSILSFGTIYLLKQLITYLNSHNV